MKDQVVLRIITKLLVPYMLVFGVYVIAHGELGPGGGFQGGVILAAGFILYGLVWGKEEASGSSSLNDTLHLTLHVHTSLSLHLTLLPPPTHPPPHTPTPPHTHPPTYVYTLARVPRQWKAGGRHRHLEIAGF